MQINGVEVDKLLAIICVGIKLLQEHIGIKGSSGHFTVLRDIPETTPLLILEIGNDGTKNLAFSIEQAERLRSNQGHLTSSQSRDVQAGKLGGAIRIPGYIFSFSGFDDEEANEALMTYLAFEAKFIENFRAINISSVSFEVLGRRNYFVRMMLHR
ncbi:MAG: hypothetical protein NTY04_04385 [Candidatus Staskawiczbacteria bacterium]|nr:hypothetical protein [Candidatus Staskawiczbacteria bacterium]